MFTTLSCFLFAFSVFHRKDTPFEWDLQTFFREYAYFGEVKNANFFEDSAIISGLNLMIFVKFRPVIMGIVSSFGKEVIHCDNGLDKRIVLPRTKTVGSD